MSGTHILRLTILIFGLHVAAANSGELKDSVNRFNDTRSVSWQSYKDDRKNFTLSAYAFYSKSTNPSPYGYYTMLSPPMGAPQFSDCNFNDWLIDGEPTPELRAQYSIMGPSETFRTVLSRAALERIASAKKVEFRICSTEGSISASDIEGVRKLLDATK